LGFHRCTVAPGFDFADFEMPPGDELAAAFPAHERVIRELTRR
jgi:predicted cupin superfamily sugar epimerase